MTKLVRFLAVAIVPILILCETGCNSPARQAIVNRTTNNQNTALNKASDGEWAIDLVRGLPDGIKQRRIRCNKEGLCWVWDENSVWIGDRANSWREFYSVSSGENNGGRIDSIYLESAQIGWVVQNHQLYKTEDGGKSLRRFSVPGLEGDPSSTVTDAFFVNGSRGWIVGGKFEPLRKNDPLINTETTRGQIRTAFIIETADGGASWKFEDLPRLIGSFEEINFWESGIGVASSRNDLVFTNDGGKTWIGMAKYFPDIDSERGRFESCFFLDQNRGWLLFTGSEFAALFTDNGGKSWTRTSWKIESKSNDTSSFSPPVRFVFVDNWHGLFVYNHTNGGELFKTSDGGKIWKLVTVAGLTDLSFTDALYESKGRALLVSNKGIYSFGL